VHFAQRRLAAASVSLAIVGLGTGCSTTSTGGTTSSSSYTITGKQVTLGLPSAVVGSLEAAGITVSPVPPAHSGTGAIVFPIKSGNLEKSSLTAPIHADGGIKFSNTAGQSVTYTNPVVPTISAIMTATHDGAQGVLLSLRPQVVLTKGSTGNGASVTGITAVIPASIALFLNGQLKTTVFTPSYNLGSISIDVAYK
jgi:hypothetical protein